MELKINDYNLPEVVSFNFEELKAEVSAKMALYETMVYSEDQVKVAKADRADLNRLKKALNDEIIKREKEYLKPFNEFKAQINEIISLIDKPIAAIDSQVKGYEDQKKADKKAEIENMWSSLTIQLPIPLTLGQIFNERWLNASVSQKQIWDEIDERIKQIETDLLTLQNLPDFSFEAIEAYKTSLDINQAIQEGKRLSEIQKKKAEQENHIIPPEEREQHKADRLAQAEAQKNWVSFKAYIDVNDALALRKFFESRNIEFEAI